MEKKSLLQVDLLDGPIFKSLVIFAIPIFVSSVFQQLYNTVDTMIVGHVLGDTSLAAIGSCTSIYDLLVGFGLGIGNGLAIVTARSFGSKDENLLKKSVASSIVIGIISSLLISVIGSIFLMPLLKVLNTPAEIIQEAYSYISIIAIFVIVMFAYNLCAGLMRAIGNSVVPLVFLVISSCFNIGLDLLFIKYMNMGVRGAAIATVISQGVSVFMCILYIIFKEKLLLPEKEHFQYDKELYIEMISQGYSMGFMSSIVSVGSVILQYGINNLGTLVIAGHTAARKIYMFFIMPYSSMGLSISTFVSQNKGADHPLRIREGMKVAYIYDFVVTVFIVIFMMACAPSLVKFITGSNEPVVLNNATLYLRVVAPNYFVLGILLQTRNALQGLGMKILPLVSSVVECVSKIIFVIVFIPMFKYMAVIFCEPVIWIIMTVYLLICFYTNQYIKNAKE